MPSLMDLFVRITGDNTSFKKSVRESGDELNRFGTLTDSMVGRMANAGTRLAGALGFGALSAGAIAAGEKFETAFVQIQRSTGATGDKLKGLQNSFVSVYKQTAASSEQVANVLGLLSTRTQATGKDLENLTLKTIQLSKTQREDVAQIVPLVTRAFGDWSIAANQQGRAMDFLRVTSQQTGTQVSRLAEQVVYAGAPLRQLGYNFDQAASLIGKFEKEGVNTELVLGGMKAALQKFAAEGITDTAGAWQKFVKGVQDGSVTLTEVMKEVGAKRGVDLFKAIQEGRFAIDDMVKSTANLATKGGENVDTLRSKFTKLQHQIEATVAAHSEMLTALGITMLTANALGPRLVSLFGMALKPIQSVVYALRFDLVGALGMAEKVLLGGGIVAALTAIGVEAYKAGDALQQKLRLST